MVKTFDRLDTRNDELNRVQDRVATAVNPIARTPTLDGRLVAVTLSPAGTTTRVAHGLGRSWVGWQLVDLAGDTRVWRSAPSTSSRPALFLDLEQSSVTSTAVTLWVF